MSDARSDTRIKQPDILVVAHGASLRGGNPAAIFVRRLRFLVPGKTVMLAFMRASPQIADVLAQMHHDRTREMLVFPLFFSKGHLVKTELPAGLCDAGFGAATLLPSAITLDGLADMMARRLRDHLAVRHRSGRESTLFVVTHGLKTLMAPLPEILHLMAHIQTGLPELNIFNANIDGHPSLSDWRSKARGRHSVFLPLLTGGGVHAAQDVPALIAPGAGEDADILEPVGIWPELPSVLMAYIRCHFPGFEAEHILFGSERRVLCNTAI
ncbi:sirohydrochlorin chelatase [Thalassospira sp.]|uniref:sirohydrochlorin chelatase n=1 Tax=Thalassospira sp. TaxID=1912094 RepID=UPI00273669E9|nr:CbiX/SirB N-terminal domain-containing protein [Thalassospira sp.]MDP2699819.1 CbiX/SirB N-terminal domain-containing protein [Thalassospira sp.]